MTNNSFVDAQSVQAAEKSLKGCDNRIAVIKRKQEQLHSLMSQMRDVGNGMVMIPGRSIVDRCEELLYSVMALEYEISNFVRKEYAEFDSYRCFPYMPPSGQFPYATMHADDTMAIRVPLAPFSIQRRAQRDYALGMRGQARFSGALGRKRYDEVRLLLRTTDEFSFRGRKVLYLLHVFPNSGRLRVAPDFDNFDVKDLIDAVMEQFGGDNMTNVMVIHDCIVDDKLPSATYLALTELNGSRSLRNQIDRFMILFRAMPCAD